MTTIGLQANSWNSTSRSFRERHIFIRNWFMNTASRIALMCFIVVLGLVYLVKTNQIATKGYDIASLERERGILAQELQSVNVQIAENRSLERVQKRAVEIQLVSFNSPSYISVADNTVARK